MKTMTPLQLENFLHKAGKKGSVYGLDTIRELLCRLDNPQERLKIVHIAGTNGKGSILTMIETVMRKCGYHTGKYTSPCIGAYGEQFLYDQKPVSMDELLQYMEEIKKACEQMERDGLPFPTIFEVETAFAFFYFAKKQVDIVLLETGMGGLLDATNVIQHPILTIFASISMDHMQFLGSTIEQIAGQKAGIIKERCPVVCYESDKRAVEVIRQKAREKNCPFYIVEKQSICVEKETYKEQCFRYGEQQFVIHLAGQHQIYNAATAVLALKQLANLYDLPLQKRKEGLEQTIWHGRLELIKKEPLVFLDGAHNEDAAKYLRHFIQKHFTNRTIIYIIGVLADKEYKKIVKQTASLAQTIFTFTPPSPRALQADVLAKEAKKEISHVKAMPGLRQAYEEALCLAKKEKETVIFIFGSLSFMNELRQICDDIDG